MIKNTQFRNFIRIILSDILALMILCSISVTTFAQKVFRYKNPISSGIDPRGIRDCQVFRDGNKWYLTGTAYPVWPKEDTFGQLNPGTPLYSSDDLINWKFERTLVLPNPEKWYFTRFWSNEIHKINGKYYLSLQCRNPLLGDNCLRIGYAVAENVMGPYKVIDQPLDKGNDLHFFQDDDGTVYAFWNHVAEPGRDEAEFRAFGMSFAKFDLEKGKFLTPPTVAIPYGNKGEWDSVGQEGTFVIKRNGIYYLFYSSWTRGYEIGYATAKKVTGPWTKFPGNPIYGGQDPAYCKKSGVPYTGDPKNPFAHAGYENIFTGPDGRLWLSCHGILAADPKQIPMLMIEPLDFDAAGNVIIGKPDTLWHEIPIPYQK
ncbi:MAG: family 43 glycosylhydrolase [Bacteroidia bacterium]|nr:family 43 glycosylhydrolase [Bacteroidia bacterium]